MKSDKQYNLKKIKNLSKFEDVFKKKLKDPEFKKRHILTVQRLELARKIMGARKKAKITQNEFAKELKTSQSFVARVENGNQNITLDVLARIANILSGKLRKPITFQIVGSFHFLLIFTL